MKDLQVFLIGSVLFCLFSGILYAQSIKLAGGPECAVFTMTSAKENRILTFELPVITADTAHVASGHFFSLASCEMGAEENPGKPSVLVFRKLISLEEFTRWETDILSLEDTFLSVPFPHRYLMPSQVSMPKSPGNGLHPFLFDTSLYCSDVWFPSGPAISLEYAGSMHGQRIGRLILRPVQYNPVQNKLRLIKKISFRIAFAEPSPLPPVHSANASPLFANMFRNVLSGDRPPLKDALTRIPIKYVILADTMFRDVIQPLVSWKKQLGYQVVEVYKGEDGTGNTPEEMRAKLTSIFRNSTLPGDPPPTYLLICGDHEQIPAFYGKTGGHLTDLYYAEYDGNDDCLPDVYYGRMSAQTPQELSNQIEKTIGYEKFLLPHPAYLDTSLLIAGVDYTYAPTYGNGQINYESTYYFNGSNGLTARTFLHPGSGAARDSILLIMNSGTGFINYTGHGEDNRWMNPYITTADIDSLKNFHKYSLVITNGCRTNAFGYPVSFGEALLRLKNRGAIGHIGGTNDTYWDEDYYWAVGVGAISSNPAYETTTLGAFDRLFHQNGESRPEWYETQGQIIFAGNLAVLESASPRSRYYWEVYHLLGDPSLRVYFGAPKSQNCQCPNMLPEGSTTLTIVAEPDAYAALTCRETLLDASGTGMQGICTFSFPPVQAGDTLVLVLTRQNRQPLIKTIPVVNISGPFVIATTDTLEEVHPILRDHRAEYGETLRLGVHLINLGKTSANDVKLKIISRDTLVHVTDSIGFISSISAGEGRWADTAFLTDISANTPDQHLALLDLVVSDQNDSTWISPLTILLHAPVPEVTRIWYSDSLMGNNNHSPDPGEFFTIHTSVTNTGSSPMVQWPFRLESSDAKFFVRTNLNLLDTLFPGYIATLTWNGQIADSVPDGDSLAYRLTFQYNGHSVERFYNRIAGSVQDDYETGATTMLPYSMEGDTGWIISAWNPYMGSFSFRPGFISHNQTSVMSLRAFLNSPGKVSFMYRISSELNYDFFDFMIDGAKVLRKSGTVPWTSFIQDVEAGWHTFTWKYSKDGNTTKGEDAVWIDNLSIFPAITDTGIHLVLKAILRPDRDSAWAETIFPVVRILNRSQIPVENISAGFFLQPTNMVWETLPVKIRPGNFIDWEFSHPLLMETEGDYVLTVFLHHMLDNEPEDDTLTVHFKRTGVEYPDSGKLLTLWPVPATDLLNVAYHGPESDLKFMITDLFGKQVETGWLHFHGNRSCLSASSLPSGLYLIRFTDLQGHTKGTFRFLVIHSTEK